jgi:hypothetical protein
MSREHAHFLGVIADKAWQQQPGSSILISLGPVARQALQAHYQFLLQRPTLSSFDLERPDLTDFSVRQVTVDGMDRLSGGLVGRLEQEAKASPVPIALPGDKMKHVLLLTDEYDELRPERLAILPDGKLLVRVLLEDLHDGRGFTVAGGIDLLKLAAEYAD